MTTTPDNQPQTQTQQAPPADTTGQDRQDILIRQLQGLVKQLQGDVANVSAQLFQTGDLKATARAAAPTGWLMADGSGVSTTYPDLRAALLADGSPWGVDGSGNPKLPDLRGRAPIGTGQGSGLTLRALAASGGEEAHALSVGEMPPHNHSASTGAAGNPTIDVRGAAESGALGGNIPIATTNGATATEGVFIPSQGGGAAHNNMPPFVAVNWMVKT